MQTTAPWRRATSWSEPVASAPRLKSDRFFTTDYTPDVYTQLGLEWINRNDMRTVLKRHYPELAPTLVRAANAFAPWWQRAAASA